MLCSVGKAVPGAGCHRVAEREWESCKKCVVSFHFFISFSLGLGGVCVYVCVVWGFFLVGVFLLCFLLLFSGLWVRCKAYAWQFLQVTLAAVESLSV